MKHSKILLVLSLAVILSILTVAIPMAPAMAAAGSLSVNPGSGPPGTSVTISGSGYTPSSTVSIWFETYNPNAISPTPKKASTNVLSATTDGTGTFSTTYIIPNQPSGDETGALNPYNFVVGAPDSSPLVPFSINPIMTMSSTTARVGDVISVGGRGFKANATIKVNFDTNTLNMPSSDYNGVFSSTFTVPEAAQGKHTMVSIDPSAASQSIDFTVNPKLTVNQTTTSVGSPLSVSGTGFTASGTVSFSVDGTAVANVVTANTVGSFSGSQITIPAVGAGNHTLKATDNSGFSDTTVITTTQSMSINPASGPAGTVITVNGGGFTANKNITITYNNAPVETSPSTVTTNASGNFTATFPAPSGAANTYSVNVTDGAVTSKATFTVSTTGKIELTTGAVGSSVPVSGSGFKAGADVTIQYDGAGVGSTKADANGAFSATFTVPPSKAGTHKITLTDGVNIINANFTTTASASFSGPSGSGNQISGYIGTEMTIKGSAFVSGGTLTVTYDSTTVATATITSDGSFSVSFKAPVSKGGNHTIVATDGTNKQTYTFVMDSTPPPAPTPASPVKDFNAPALANFQWSPVTSPNGITYTLQLARDAGFNSIVVQKVGLTAPTYQLTDQEKLDSTGSDKPYYWRVKAIDGASNESPWSTSLTFTVGFIMPSWLLYFLYAVGAVVVFAIGFLVGRRSSRYGT